MLEQRLLTAAILIPAVVWGVLALPTAWLAVPLGMIALLGAWEWTALMQMPTRAARLAYVALLLALGLLVFLANAAVLTQGLLLVAVSWWCMALVWVGSYRGQTGLTRRDRLAGPVLGLLVLLPCWLSLLAVHGSSPDGPRLLLFLLILIWTADSAAYFAGRTFGRHKLAPHVSPGKSWEGAAGAAVGTLIVAVVGARLFGYGLAGFVALCLVTACFSVVGDLMESLFKRRVGVKDSGALLPGHGGVLDRIDSLTAAGPVFAAGLMLLGR